MSKLPGLCGAAGIDGTQPGPCEDAFDRLTYTRPCTKDNTLNDNDLARKCPLDNGRRPFPRAPRHGLGQLDGLPLELLHTVLAQLDLRALTDFRRVNQRAMQVVDGVPQYKAIIAHAPNAIRGALTIGTGRWTTCERLHDALCTAACDKCGDFGGYLYLITCRRVCSSCLDADAAFLPLVYRAACRAFGIDVQTIDTLPRMISAPGTYAPSAVLCRDRRCLVDRDAARAAGVAAHGSVEAMRRYVCDCEESSRMEKCEERVARARASGFGPAPSPRPPSPSRAAARRFEAGPSVNPVRYMAVVRAPVLDRRSQGVEWGAYCVGCRREARASEEEGGHARDCGRRLFTRASFGEHLRERGLVRDGEHHRNDEMMLAK